MQKLYIIKIGGNIVNDEFKLARLLKSVSCLQEKVIVVHGGGKLVNTLAEKLSIPQQMIDGRRITDGPTLELATMVYAGLVNKKIVALLQSYATNAIGLSGADGNSIKAKQRIHETLDFGFVGDIETNSINVSFISSLIEENRLPVFCSITHNGNGQLLNTNADTIAAELAIALSNQYEIHLKYCFEMKGVMGDIAEQNSLISVMSLQLYEELKNTGAISAGMIPKLNHAFAVVRGGTASVTILHADDIENSIEFGNVGTTLIK